MTRRVLYDLIKKNDVSSAESSTNILREYVKNITNCPIEHEPELLKKMSLFVSVFNKKWNKSNRTHKRFLSKNQIWLDSTISFPQFLNRKKVGRPAKKFNDCSDRAKRLKTEHLRSDYTSNELVYATQMKYRSAGQWDAANVLKEVAISSPTRMKNIRKSSKNTNKNEIRLSGDEALSVFIEAQLTKHQYNTVRNADKSKFPPYTVIQTAKRQCYPDPQFINITESSAEISLQALLNHTAFRLLKSQSEVLVTQEAKSLQLICKWGFDGSAQSTYKQKFSDVSVSDANIFITSLVPIKITSINNSIIWQNVRTSSTRYCRPIRFQFKKETAELSRNEKDYISKQIEHLVPGRFEIEGVVYKVHYQLLLTMIDGKVCNAISDTKSTQRCFLCGLTQKTFNNISTVLAAEVKNPELLNIGLSTLHARIRFLECVLSLSYRLTFEEWAIYGEEKKMLLMERKKKIQNDFYVRLGLIVDKPKQGLGSSNDGNTARRVFENWKTSAEITGFDETLLYRLKVVLDTISSGFEINVDKFRAYTLDTAKLFVQLYSWYPMPPTIHKVLIHGPDFVLNAIIPIGQLCEEAQEARNKEFKRLYILIFYM